MADTGEQVLFDKDDVRVTHYRFVVENTVYAMRNITSIRHDVCQPPTPPDNYCRDVAIAGAIVLFFGLVILVSDAPVVLSVLAAITGSVLLAYGYFLSNYHPANVFLGDIHRLCNFLNDRFPETIRHVPPATPLAIHTVILTTSAQEHSALTHTDEEFITEVLAALARIHRRRGSG